MGRKKEGRGERERRREKKRKAKRKSELVATVTYFLEKILTPCQSALVSCDHF